MTHHLDSQPHHCPQTETLCEQKRTIIERLKEFASFSLLLRLSGALMVVASMSAFLLQDWALGNDINRFYLLLGQTVILSLAGFALSFILKENKGARVFFGLGLISVAVYMTTLGALIFSTLQWGAELGHYPQQASWIATSFASLLLPMMAALLVMLPMVVFAYRVLARHSAKGFSLIYIVANLLLLLPIRESWLLAIGLSLATLIPLAYATKRFMQDSALRTFEGCFAVLTLFIPMLILIARNLWLYQLDTVLQMVLALLAFVTIRTIVQVLSGQSNLKYCLNWICVIVAGLIAVPAAELLNDLNRLFFSANIFYSMMSFVFVAFVLDIGKRSEWNKNAFANIAGFALLFAHIVQSLWVGGLISSILTVFAGIFIFMIGKQFARKPLLITGLLTIMYGTAQQLYQVFSLVDFGHWISLAVTGIVAIIIASLLERYGLVLKLKWNKWSSRSLSSGELDSY